MQEQIIAGRYRVISALGAGGMGVVYTAEHLGTARHVALKLLLSSLFGIDPGEVAAKRFLREAKTIGSLRSRNVVDVYDSGRDPETGRLFIAMELLSGTDLNAVLKRVGKLNPDVALRILGQACVGLAAAHAIGILHRDMKPGNLFLSQEPDGNITVKLLDFGIAKVTNDPRLTEITGSGEIVGTPAYMAPEQARGLSKADARSDVWSVGAVLYKALSGSSPHGSTGNMLDQVIELCTKPVVPLHARAPWVPAHVCAIVDRALQLEQDQRYRDANEMLAAIVAVTPQLGVNVRELVPADASVMATEVPVRPVQTSSRWRAVVVSLVALVCVLVGVGGWLLLRVTRAPAEVSESPISAVPSVAASPSPSPIPTPVALPSPQPTRAPAPSSTTTSTVTTRSRLELPAASQKPKPRESAAPPALTMAPAFE